MSHAVELRDVSVTTGGRVRLHPTSLQISTGTVTGVIGRNGSGKSTMLEVMSSELTPTSGSVLLFGDDASSLSLVERARRRAILSQETMLAFPFTVREVVSWGRTPWRGTDRSVDDDTMIASAMAQQGVDALSGRAVTELSGGERKRVHLARVVAQDCPLLILDEADSDLDLLGRRVIDDVVAAHARSGSTAVVVSHDVNRLARFCDAFVVMADGRIQAHGATHDVLTEPILSEAFGARVIVERRDDGLSVHLPD